ncbi:MAG TPA: RNA-binding domain-containing protein [Thermoplasmata archaeon]|nr:RNA-binding domain-containing protein [Thermoplasmata archaeon]
MKIMTRVRVEAAVHATESPARVKRACLNLFPDLTFVETDEGLVGEGSDLEYLRELIRNQKIRDSARDILIRGRSENTIRFSLNKQAAYVGRVNVGTGSPLGDLAVTIEDPDVDALIDRVAESTLGRRLSGPDRTEGT